MSKKINLFWYKHNEGHGNFGDALNPYIIGKLTGREIKHFPLQWFDGNLLLNFKVLTMQFLQKKINFLEYIDYSIYNLFKHTKVILGIGSILCFKNGKNVWVWGSGIIEKKAKFGNAKFVAVRGKCTENRLKELDYKLPMAYGDPALLLPMIYQPRKKKKNKIGIIPHFIHYNELRTTENNDITVINLTDPIEKVIDVINSCEFILSTSLHGIIVSHAYQVSSLWVDFQSNKKLQGDDIKFEDYFSSVNIECYKPFTLNISDLNISNIIKLFEGNANIANANTDVISKLQASLIEYAPFTVVKEYKL